MRVFLCICAGLLLGVWFGHASAQTRSLKIATGGAGAPPHGIPRDLDACGTHG